MKKLGKEAHAAVLLMVAKKTIGEARAAWRRAGDSERGLRSAFLACVLAARTARTAANAWAHDPNLARQLIEDAELIENAAEDVKHRLAAVVVAALSQAGK